MGMLNNIGGPSGPQQGLNRRNAGSASARPADTSARESTVDRLELSDAAVRLARLEDRPNAHVERVRGEIAAGTYETDQRINATIERVFADLTAFETRI